MRDRDCIELLQEVLPRMGLQWPGFRKPRGQVCKRISRRMEELGIRSLDGYRERLDSDPAEWRVLDSLCRVTISRFRRDQGLWVRLAEEILPRLASGLGEERGVLRVWSAGCASGEEPYTLSLLWRLQLGRRFPEVEPFVLATDFDPHMVFRARQGVFASSTTRELPDEWQEIAFDPAPEEAEDDLHLRETFRTPVRLACADLRQELPRGPFDLILCRNLAFTYFGEDLQTRVAAGLSRCAAPGAFLAVGSHETLPKGAETWEEDSQGLYRLR